MWASYRAQVGAGALLCESIAVPIRITIRETIPTPGPISGTTPVCNGTNGVAFSVPIPASSLPFGGATEYAWEVVDASNAVVGDVTLTPSVGQGAVAQNITANFGSCQPDTEPADRIAGAPMHYTSGTTGRPKGVKRALVDIDPDVLGELYSGFQGMFGVPPLDGNVHITGSPLYHTAVLMWTANALHMGHTVVVMDKWSPEGMLQLIDEHEVTTSHMVPTQFHRLLALPDDVRAKYDVSSTRCMVHAAAPCPPDVKRRMIDWWGDSIMEYYAATEGGGTIVTAAEWMTKPGTVGKAWPGSEIRILDDAHKDVPTGQEGTVYMSLALADFEYKGDAAKTNENRTEGFFTVGDWGLLDEDGYLFLKDRKADMIISGGVNIYPAEIEGTLLTFPKIGDVAVFGIPNDDWGEEIKAVVQPAEGIEPDDALRDEIIAFCIENLASYKRPKSIDFSPELPRDPSGKFYKRKLRDPFWAGRDARI